MKYTMVDKDGVRWRWDGGRPVSEIADKVMSAIKPKPKRKCPRKDK